MESPTDCALVIAYADGEPDGFKAQSKAFHGAWLNAGNRAALLEIPKRNHFDVILDLADTKSGLFRSVLNFIEPTN